MATDPLSSPGTSTNRMADLDGIIAGRLFGSKGFSMVRNEMAEVDYAVPLPFSSDINASALLKAELCERGVRFLILLQEGSVAAFPLAALRSGGNISVHEMVIAKTEPAALALFAKKLIVEGQLP